jgi:hypothetical protein
MKTRSVWRYAALAVFVAFAVTSCSKPPSPEELKASVEIVEVSSKWVAKEYEPWPPKLTLVPVISFRVKNLSAKPLNYLNFNAIFKEQDAQENLGDNFLAAIRKEPIPPGETSHVITLKSNFGVQGKSLASFQDNPNWKTFVCKLFIQSKGSPHVPLGEYQISRTIDFKEPEPVGKEKKEEEKKG